MTAIERVVKRTMRERGLSRGDLAKLMGRKNASKALRHLDEFFAKATTDRGFINDLQRVLEIPVTEFLSACDESRLAVKERDFSGPEIVLRSPKKIRSFSRGIWFYPAAMIAVPPGVLHLSFSEECRAVHSLVRQRLVDQDERLRYWEICGYLYRRRFDQALEFDLEGSLVECWSRDRMPAPRC